MRVFVASYVWLTGFGNFAFFHRQAPAFPFVKKASSTALPFVKSSKYSLNTAFFYRQAPAFPSIKSLKHSLLEGLFCRQAVIKSRQPSSTAPGPAPPACSYPPLPVTRCKTLNSSFLGPYINSRVLAPPLRSLPSSPLLLPSFPNSLRSPPFYRPPPLPSPPSSLFLYRLPPPLPILLLPPCPALPSSPSPTLPSPHLAPDPKPAPLPLAPRSPILPSHARPPAPPSSPLSSVPPPFRSRPLASLPQRCSARQTTGGAPLILRAPPRPHLIPVCQQSKGCKALPWQSLPQRCSARQTLVPPCPARRDTPIPYSYPSVLLSLRAPPRPRLDFGPPPLRVCPPRWSAKRGTRGPAAAAKRLLMYGKHFYSKKL